MRSLIYNAYILGTPRIIAPPHHSYKLIVDPLLLEGVTKMYRFDGIEFDRPPMILRDPRPPFKRTEKQTVDLRVPRFEVKVLIIH